MHYFLNYFSTLSYFLTPHPRCNLVFLRPCFSWLWTGVPLSSCQKPTIYGLPKFLELSLKMSHSFSFLFSLFCLHGHKSPLTSKIWLSEMFSRHIYYSPFPFRLILLLSHKCHYNPFNVSRFLVNFPSASPFPTSPPPGGGFIPQITLCLKCFLELLLGVTLVCHIIYMFLKTVPVLLSFFSLLGTFSFFENIFFALCSILVVV